MTRDMFALITYDNLHHQQKEKLYGSVVQMCMAKNVPPPRLSGNQIRRTKNGRAARRRRLRARQSGGASGGASESSDYSRVA